MLQHIDANEEKGKLWKLLEQVARRRCPKSPLWSEDRLHFTDGDKGEVMAKHFELQFSNTDSVPNYAFRSLDPSAIDRLTASCIIYNAVLIVEYVPRVWKQAIIVAIPKGTKDPARPVNYRPVSLLGGFAKILEIILKEEFTTYAELKNLIPSAIWGPIVGCHTTSC